VCCSVLQCVGLFGAENIDVKNIDVENIAVVFINIMCSFAVCCSVLQCVAVYCNVLQYIMLIKTSVLQLSLSI